MTRGKDGRFLLIDGLRGIAALSVVFYHFNEALSRNQVLWVPAAVSALLRHGYLGVDVFFVISGFVIAYSIRDGNYTPGYLFRFALRRSIRLDPPYWATITAELGLIALGLLFIPSLGTQIPSSGEVIAHLFYAQNILETGNILPIFWTLCFEVQFYLFVVFLGMIWQFAAPALSLGLRRWGPPLVLGALFVSSLIIRFTPASLPIPGLALGRWFQFFLGVMVWWCVAGKISVKPILLAWGAIAAMIVMTQQASVTQLLAIAVSAAVLFAARRGQLSTWLSGGSVQFLGKISYSLYLFHLPIGWRFISLCQQISGPGMSPLVAALVFVAAVGITVVGAWISYRLLEAPSMRLSKRIRLPAKESARVRLVVPSGPIVVPVAVWESALPAPDQQKT